MQQVRIELLQRMPIFGGSELTSSNFCSNCANRVCPDQ